MTDPQAHGQISGRLRSRKAVFSEVLEAHSEAVFSEVLEAAAKFNSPIPDGGGNRCNDMRIMDQLEELRGCDERLTACMLDRLGDLRR